jgi:putative membrane protein
MRMAIHLIVTALALLGVAYFVPGISVDSIYVALAAALVLGILNMLVKPILIALTFPITILTLGLFIFVINAIVFAAAAWFVPGFEVSGFFPALLGSVIVAFVSTAVGKLLK